MGTRLIGLVLSPVAAPAVVVAAVPASSIAAPALAASAHRKTTITEGLTGTVDGFARSGTLAVTRFANQAGQLVAVGDLSMGGVNLVMPDNYSAHLETSTVNGNVSSDFPLNVPLTSRGRIPKEISVDLGSGGPTIRATTTNGGVRVARASSM